MVVVFDFLECPRRFFCLDGGFVIFAPLLHLLFRQPFPLRFSFLHEFQSLQSDFFLFPCLSQIRRGFQTCVSFLKFGSRLEGNRGASLCRVRTMILVSVAAVVAETSSPEI